MKDASFVIKWKELKLVMQIDYLNNKGTTLFQQVISCNLMKFLNVKQVSNA